MRILNQNNEEINENEVDINAGYLSSETVINECADPIDNITKFAYNDSDYEQIIRYIPFSDAELMQKRIDELKKKLQSTDYIVIKIFEGVATKEDYNDRLYERTLWRKEINELEEKLDSLK